MTVEEIAQAMDLSPSTVKRALEHATKKLSRWIGADPDLAGFLGGCMILALVFWAFSNVS